MLHACIWFELSSLVYRTRVHSYTHAHGHQHAALTQLAEKDYELLTRRRQTQLLLKEAKQREAKARRKALHCDSLFWAVVLFTHAFCAFAV